MASQNIFNLSLVPYLFGALCQYRLNFMLTAFFHKTEWKLLLKRKKNVLTPNNTGESFPLYFRRNLFHFSQREMHICTTKSSRQEKSNLKWGKEKNKAYELILWIIQDPVFIQKKTCYKYFALKQWRWNCRMHVYAPAEGGNENACVHTDIHEHYSYRL